MKSSLGQTRWRVAGAALVALSAALVLWKSGAGRRSGADSPPPSAAIAASPATGETPPPRRGAARDSTPHGLRLSDLPPLPAPQRPPHPPGSQENEEWIETTTGALADLAWEDDADSMRKILAELRSPLPEIRAAALDATRDFDDPAAIPYLRAISRDTADLLEVSAISELIEHLSLPAFIDSID